MKMKYLRKFVFLLVTIGFCISLCFACVDQRYLFQTFIFRLLMHLFRDTAKGGETSAEENDESTVHCISKALRVEGIEPTPDNIKRLYLLGYKGLAFKCFCKLPGNTEQPKRTLKQLFREFVEESQETQVLMLTERNVLKLYRKGYESLAFRQFCKLEENNGVSRVELTAKFAGFVKE